MSTLIVILNSPSTSPAELAYGLVSNAQTLASHGSAVIALLPKADEIVVMVPSAALSWHKVQLPKLPRSTSAQKLRAVLEGLVEEHLLDDTAQVHLALYRTAGLPNNTAWVAVCHKAWLLEQVRSLQAAGLSISRIVPQSYPLVASVDPQLPNQRMHISGTPETALATVASSTEVLTVPLQHASAIWPAWQGGDAGAITAEPAVAALAEAQLDTKVTIVQSAQHALHTLLDVRALGLDLAQGDLAVAGSGRWLQVAGGVLRDLVSAPAWRMARIGAVVLLVAHLVGLNVWAWQERATLQAKRNLSSQILTQAFPQLKVVVDAPLQMQREVGILRQASGTLGSRDLESLYARFASAAGISAAPTAIDFASGEVSVKGLGLGASQLSEMQTKLQAVGLSARSEADRVVITELAAKKQAGAL
jgi:general secretion pathway protein L